MNKILFLFCMAFFLIAACNAPVKGKNGITYKNAMDYNDYIVQKQNNVVQLIEQFKTISQGPAAQTDSFLTEAASKVDNIITDVAGMPEWKKSTDLRDKAVSMFQFYKTIFSETYKRIIAYTSDGEVTTEEEKEQEKLLNSMGEIGTPLETAFLNAQNDFATKNNMKLEKKTP